MVGWIGCLIRKTLFSFGEDPTPVLNLSDFSPLRGPKTICSVISQKVMHGFGQNLLDSLSVPRKNFDFGEDLDLRIFIFLRNSSPLRDEAKNDTWHDISKSCEGVVTKLGG